MEIYKECEENVHVNVRDTGYFSYSETDRYGADCIVAAWRLTTPEFGLKIKYITYFVCFESTTMHYL